MTGLVVPSEQDGQDAGGVAVTVPTANDPQGIWNAYVAAGDTREERRARLAQAPEQMRPGIESHVRTVFALRQRGQHEEERE